VCHETQERVYEHELMDRHEPMCAVPFLRQRERTLRHKLGCPLPSLP
jgi:hypothetical protein